jgi:SAM-dependent methyltransferase
MVRPPYTDAFYRRHQSGARQSARSIIPLVLRLIRPTSVIDVGCGTGTWLSVFRESGIEHILGVDGGWVNKSLLEIREEEFLSVDLKKPLRLRKQFDLVLSLEVAEHLPGEAAEIFVDSLTRLGPVVLFSAAIPYQGGTNHINEQWPEYWAKHFRERCYVVIDCIRKNIWQNSNVEWWYAQNILIFSRQDHLERHPLLKKEWENTPTSQLSVVHPRNYLEALRLHLTVQDLAALTAPSDSIIVVDDGVFRDKVTIGRAVLPFLERDGQYWGPPPDDETAISEFERLRQAGAGFIVFGWPAFWWLGYYSKFLHHLRSHFRCVLENERLIMFNSRS